MIPCKDCITLGICLNKCKVFLENGAVLYDAFPLWKCCSILKDFYYEEQSMTFDEINEELEKIEKSYLKTKIKG